MDDFLSAVMRNLNEPDPFPYLFEVGQKVRVKKNVIHDGQTPHFWAGAICNVLHRRSTIFSQTHSYTLQHDNGAKDFFEECELDVRYSRLTKKEVINEL